MPIRRALPDGLPPLRRIREFACLLGWLKKKGAGATDVSISRLRAELVRICGAASLWTAMADRMLVGLEVELGDTPCGALEILEAMHRGLADHHRSHIVGDGVLVSTVHAAKGLEFDHVLVLGGGWSHRPSADLSRNGDGGSDEERRLYYVAMTRSRKSLALLDRQDDPLPYAREIGGSRVLQRRADVVRDAPRRFPDIVSYRMLGMKDLYLDFAGRKRKDHRVHGSLRHLQTGDAVQLQRSGNGHVLVLDSRRTAVARLANSTAEGWDESQLHQVDEVRVFGMAARTRGDCGPEFQEDIAVPDWELPILEVRYRGVKCI